MSADFVAHMEEVLDLYEEPYDPRRPVVSFDETSTSCWPRRGRALPPRPGIPLRQDYEYRREGVRNLFLTCEPQAGWRHVAVTQRRTIEDFAQQMRWLVDEAYPEVEVVRLVLDNLNTHRTAQRRRPAGSPTAGVPLHRQARELVQRAVPLLPQAARPQRTRPPAGGPSPGHGAK